MSPPRSFADRLLGDDAADSTVIEQVQAEAFIADVFAADEDDARDETERMLVIPISDEIPADFRLVDGEKTLKRIQDVLAQRGKQRNVILVGDPGSGKTSHLHGLVQRANAGDLSTHMYKRTFDRLNTSRLLHMDVSECNSEFDRVMEELSYFDVFTIENFYTFMTHLKLKGANNVLIAFLEALSHRRFQSIITCTKRELGLIKAEVPEIHEFFAEVEIPEPNDDQLLAILRGIHNPYEVRYGVTLPDATLRMVLYLTQKYRKGMEGWVQPGRATLLLDRGIAQFSVQMNSRSDELAAAEAEIIAATDEIESLMEDKPTPQDEERCKVLRARIAELQPKAKEWRQQWTELTAPIQKLQIDKMVLDKRLHSAIIKRNQLQKLRSDSATMTARGLTVSQVTDDLNIAIRMIEIARTGIHGIDESLGKINLSGIRDHVITPEHIAKTYAEWSDIPVNELTADEVERIMNMEEILGKRVFGQGQAIKTLANAVRRERAGLTGKQSGPKAVFLILGPSGVGKTELCKALAQFLTADEANMVRIDMGEYMEPHSVSRLVGAPPGYTGYEAGGLLTNAIKVRPKAVVVFDEAEKAHPDVFKILLQMTSDGRMTSGQGETIPFGETYCMFTSNLGGTYFTDDALTFEEAQEKAIESVKKFFAPEFIGRLGGIICFHRLGVDMLIRVAKTRVKALNDAISDRNLSMEWPDPQIDDFCLTYQDPHYGARPILTTMAAKVEPMLANEILANRGKTGTFHVNFEHGAIEAEITFVPKA